MEPFQDLMDSETLHEVFNVVKKTWSEIEIKTRPDAAITPVHYSIFWIVGNKYVVYNEQTRDYLNGEFSRDQLYDMIHAIMEG